MTWPRRRKRRPQASTTDRGYGHEHRKLRAEYAPRVAAGVERCRRCGHTIQPWQAWDLDHTDDRTGYLGPSHAKCNRATAGRRKRKRPARVSREW